MRTVFAATALTLMAGSAFAGTTPVAVPEIDAGAGVAALAALGAGVAIVWERWRRR
jgi:hypothetical protein